MKFDLERFLLKLLMAWLLLCAIAAFALSADLGNGSPPRPQAGQTTVVPPSSVKVLTPFGLHAHVCPACGTRWEHGHESKGSVAQHTCPKCGTVQWEKASVIVAWRTICNGGQCVRVPVYAP
jgi:predicted RNA-binding Zn-ribbon protein involved in translation (DUF1610 family)